MQSLIPFLAILSAVSCSQLTLVPYAYLVDPLPVYHQSQDTRTGEHAYSYSGGPSAKEEVKGPDGVTRGSYSYVDAHGILQSVFYVADEGGFRVAATNLPTDSDLPSEPAEILLAKKTLFEEQAKAASKTSRRRRSLSDEDLARKVEEPKDDKKTTVEPAKEGGDEPGRPYGALAAFLLPGSVPTATSHQSHVQIHQNVRTEPVIESANAVAIEAAPVLPGLPISTSHQSRVQIHNTPVKLETVDVLAATPLVHTVHTVPVIATDYHQNRVLIHRNIGLEGERRKDAVKIETPTLLGVHTFLPERYAILEHRPSVYEFPAFLSSIPLASSSQYRSQVHSSQRIESADAESQPKEKEE